MTIKHRQKENLSVIVWLMIVSASVLFITYTMRFYKIFIFIFIFSFFLVALLLEFSKKILPYGNHLLWEFEEEYNTEENDEENK
ncbi:MAG: hypothetical protein ABH967_02260 [Patescibacteria group bacterium]